MRTAMADGAAGKEGRGGGTLRGIALLEHEDEWRHALNTGFLFRCSSIPDLSQMMRSL
jgi:hypothetical protein